MDAVFKAKDFLEGSADPFDDFAFSSTRQTLDHVTQKFLIRLVDGVAADLTGFKQAALQNQTQNL